MTWRLVGGRKRGERNLMVASWSRRGGREAGIPWDGEPRRESWCIRRDEFHFRFNEFEVPGKQPKSWSSGKKRCIWFYFLIYDGLHFFPGSTIITQFIQEFLRLIFLHIFLLLYSLGKKFILQVLRIDISSGASTRFWVKWTDRPNDISHCL